MAIDLTTFREPNRVRLGIIGGQLAVCLCKDVVDELGFDVPDDGLLDGQYLHYSLMVDRDLRNIVIGREIRQYLEQSWRADESTEQPGLYLSDSKVDHDYLGEVAQVLRWRHTVTLTGLRRDDVVPAGVERYEIEGGRISIWLPDWILDANWQPAKPRPQAEAQSG
jgi:hypothetical protein